MIICEPCYVKHGKAEVLTYSQADFKDATPRSCDVCLAASDCKFIPDNHVDIKAADIVDANQIVRLATRAGRHSVDADATSRDYAAWHESTRDPIFLFQKRVVTGIDPDGLGDDDHYFDGDTLWVTAEHFEDEEIAEAAEDDRVLLKKDDIHMPFDKGIAVSDQELVDFGWALYYWDTQKVFRTRKEAEAWGQGQRHNYGVKNQGWQVYCVPCEGELAEVLKHVDRVEALEFVKSQAFREAFKNWHSDMMQQVGAVKA